MRASSTPLSRWWSSSLSISTSPGSMWWRWTRTARRTAASQGECRLSPSRRRSSSPSPPTRTPTYEPDRTHEHVSPHQGFLHSHLGRFYFPTLGDGDIVSREFTWAFSRLHSDSCEFTFFTFSRIIFWIKNIFFFLPQITQLKIDHNPFAKGFRDNYDT